MLKIGITGGMGSGKTTVCHIFETLNIPVFYADDESKNILQSDPLVILQVKENFGNDIYKDEKLDRKKLAEIVFSNPEKLKRLNAISHPSVFQKFNLWANNQLAPYIIKEAALIFETGANEGLDKVIVVNAPEDVRINRIRARDGLSEKQVLERMRNQWPIEEKLKRADFIIHNDGEQSLILQVLRIHKSLL